MPRINREAIQAIRAKQSESERLLLLLDFYGWLEDHGLSWDIVKGIRPLDNTPVSRNEFKRTFRQNGRLDLWEKYNTAPFIEGDRRPGRLFGNWQLVSEDYDGPAKVTRRPKTYRGKFIDILLKDGKKVILPWPPFPQDVIYNRRRYEPSDK